MKTGQMLVKFIRKGRGRAVGVVVATGPKQIGWAVCHRNDMLPGRVIDKDIAISIAKGRSFEVKNPSKLLKDGEVPITARKEFEKMINRAKNFKGF